ncbi:hypothetical protein QIH07_28210, partial [Klebsiella pneumoniae]|nr:hypothetical protein [Klebsiella pneumoniae]
ASSSFIASTTVWLRSKPQWGGNIAWGTELQTGDVLYIDDEGLLKPNPAFFSLGRRSFAGRGLLVGPERP